MVITQETEAETSGYEVKTQTTFGDIISHLCDEGEAVIRTDSPQLSINCAGVHVTWRT